MRRSAAVIGSIAVHAILLLVVLATRDTEVPIALVEPERVEITRVDLVPREPTPIEASTGGGGGSPIVQTAAPSRARTTAMPRMTSVASYLGRVTMDGGEGDGTGGEGGTGAGYGGGNGTGFGLGTGGGIERDELQTLSLPPPPPASKARPPILIYPRRTAEAEEGETFLARVKIDHQGYVVGAKIVRGVAPDLNLSASDLIWRFRYLPALDDAGTPISWTLDQPFLVQ